MKLVHQIILIGTTILLLCACSDPRTTKVERAMYYWKSNTGHFSMGELSSLGQLEVQKMYIKFFEVEPDDIFGSIPTSKLGLRIWEETSDYMLEEDSTLPTSLKHIEVVPTIYIRNEVFYKATKSTMDTLADNIVFLVDKYFDDRIKSRPQGYSEIQIDCDWTANTKDTYFYLLQQLKQLSKKDISCTLRLYPYKYPDLVGVPPVDKVTLMCYNLINPIENDKENSIQNNEELEKYLNGAEEYPIHLDVALPIYRWMQVYQNNRFVKTINSIDFILKYYTKKEDDLWYTMTSDYELDDLYLRVGDKIKLEGFTPADTHESIALLQEYLNFDDSTTVTLFHLDETNMQQYEHETYTEFYTDFSQ